MLVIISISERETDIVMHFILLKIPDLFSIFSNFSVLISQNFVKMNIKFDDYYPSPSCPIVILNCYQ